MIQSADCKESGDLLVAASGVLDSINRAKIENNVSVGSGVTILPARITEGCVIGAGSVVTKNLKVKGIYAGNPAKLIRRL